MEEKRWRVTGDVCVSMTQVERWQSSQRRGKRRQAECAEDLEGKGSRGDGREEVEGDRGV